MQIHSRGHDAQSAQGARSHHHGGSDGSTHDLNSGPTGVAAPLRSPPAGPTGWTERHQAVQHGGGWRQLLNEPIDKKPWDHQFAQEVSGDALVSRSLELTPGALPELLVIGRESNLWLLDTNRRRMLGTIAQQQHHTFEIVAKAWAAQQVWLIKLQIADLRDIQAELATRMTAAGNWPKKELLEWLAKKNKAQDALDAARLEGERQFAELRLTLQHTQQAIALTPTKLQKPTVWSVSAAENNAQALQQRARRAVQESPGILGRPLDLWRSYQGAILAYDQAESAGRSFTREKEHADLATKLLSEALLEYNGMLISTFSLLDYQIEKLNAEIDVVLTSSLLLQRQSALRRTLIQTLLLEADFGVRS